MVISYELWPLAFCLSWFNIHMIKMIIMFYIFFQHQRMIKMSSVSIQKRDIAMDLRKFWHDTEKLSLNFGSQVLCLSFPETYVFDTKLLNSTNWFINHLSSTILWQDQHLLHLSLKWPLLSSSKVLANTMFYW